MRWVEKITHTPTRFILQASRTAHNEMSINLQPLPMQIQKTIPVGTESIDIDLSNDMNLGEIWCHRKFSSLQPLLIFCYFKNFFIHLFIYILLFSLCFH